MSSDILSHIDGESHRVGFSPFVIFTVMFQGLDMMRSIVTTWVPRGFRVRLIVHRAHSGHGGACNR